MSGLPETLAPALDALVPLTPYAVSFIPAPVYKFLVGLRKQHPDLRAKTIFFTVPTWIYLAAHGALGVFTYWMFNDVFEPATHHFTLAIVCGLAGPGNLSPIIDTLLGGLGSQVKGDDDQDSDASKKVMECVVEVTTWVKQAISERLHHHRARIVAEFTACFQHSSHVADECRRAVADMRHSLAHEKRAALVKLVDELHNGTGDDETKRRSLGDFMLATFGEKELRRRTKLHRQKKQSGL